MCSNISLLMMAVTMTVFISYTCIQIGNDTTKFMETSAPIPKSKILESIWYEVKADPPTTETPISPIHTKTTEINRKEDTASIDEDKPAGRFVDWSTKGYNVLKTMLSTFKLCRNKENKRDEKSFDWPTKENNIMETIWTIEPFQNKEKKPSKKSFGWHTIENNIMETIWTIEPFPNKEKKPAKKSFDWHTIQNNLFNVIWSYKPRRNK